MIIQQIVKARIYCYIRITTDLSIGHSTNSQSANLLLYMNTQPSINWAFNKESKLESTDICEYPAIYQLGIQQRVKAWIYCYIRITTHLSIGYSTKSQSLNLLLYMKTQPAINWVFNKESKLESTAIYEYPASYQLGIQQRVKARIYCYIRITTQLSIGYSTNSQSANLLLYVNNHTAINWVFNKESKRGSTAIYK